MAVVTKLHASGAAASAAFLNRPGGYSAAAEQRHRAGQRASTLLPLAAMSMSRPTNGVSSRVAKKYPQKPNLCRRPKKPITSALKITITIKNNINYLSLLGWIDSVWEGE